MKFLSLTTRLPLLIVLCGVFTQAFAQRFELHPYVGGAFPGKLYGLDFKNSAIFGVKAGVIAANGFEIEGHLGRLSEFELEGASRDIFAVRWEGVGTYNFFPSGTDGIWPFVTFGIGGLTMRLKDDSIDRTTFAVLHRSIRTPSGANVERTQTLIIDDWKTFLNLSYGGGLKAHRLWGPIGLRFNVGGQMIPNFFDNAVHAFETSGGIIFSWGER